jgi:hypothetical protein
LTSGLPEHQLLPDLSFTYGDLNFNNRDQVLATAKVEDHWVAAYNGAGRLLSIRLSIISRENSICRSETLQPLET